MAVRYRSDEEEQQRRQVSGAMQGESLGMMSSGQQNMAQPARQNTSGSFTNLVTFLDANRDQAKTMGERVGGDIDKQIQEGSQTIDKTATDYRNRVDQGTLKLDQNLINKTIANPTGDTTDVRNLLKGEYKGPTRLQDTDLYTPFSQKVADLQTTKELSNTSGGRNVLLGKTYGNPATAKFDQFLVTKTEPAWNRIMGSLNQIDPTVTKANSTVDELAALTPAAQAASKTAGQQARTQLEGARNVIRDDVNSELSRRTASEAQSQEQLKQKISQIDNDIASGNFANVNLDDATLKQLGMTREQWDKYLGDAETAYYRNSFGAGAKVLGADDLRNQNDYNLDSLLNITPGQLGTGDVATQEQKDRYTGLQQLLDDPSAFFTPGQQAVTNFDVNAFAAAIQNRYGQSADVGGSTLGQLNGEAGRQQAAENVAAGKKALQGAASGAATGAQIGSVVPGIGNVVGAVIGGVLGYVANGGIKSGLSDGGFKGGTQEEAVKNGDIGRQLANPIGAIGARVGVNSNSALGKALDPHASLTQAITGKDTQGTTDYKSYKKQSGDAVAGRNLSQSQYDSLRYHGFKHSTGEPGVKDLVTAFIGPGSIDSNKNRVYQLTGEIEKFIVGKLNDYKTSGRLPSDSNALTQLDGQKVFANAILPELNAFIEGKTGKKNALSATGKSTADKFLADMTDYLMVNNVAGGKPLNEPYKGSGLFSKLTSAIDSAKANR